MSGPASWPSEQILREVAPDLRDLRVEVLKRIDSTNSELMRRARSGPAEPILLVAEQQTDGRGRLGRHWFSGEGAGSSLTFSIGMPLAPLDWSGLSLAVGLSIVQSLHPDLLLKWPNDVWWHERKLAGILIETAGSGIDRYLVVGVGINIKNRDGEGLATPPAWLNELLPDLDAPSTLLRIAPALVRTIKAFESQGFAPFRASFNERDALQGLHVALSDGTLGVARGVDGVGALQVQSNDEMKSVVSAEVSVRPVSEANLKRP